MKTLFACDIVLVLVVVLVLEAPCEIEGDDEDENENEDETKSGLIRQSGKQSGFMESSLFLSNRLPGHEPMWRSNPQR